MRARAKRLYLRGRGLVLKALELRYPGFITELKTQDYKNMLAKLQVQDVPYHRILCQDFGSTCDPS